MPVYEYIAKDTDGKEFVGKYSGIKNKDALRDELSKLDYVLVSASEQKRIGLKYRKIRQSEVVAFIYKFSGMYSAGLPILECLMTLEKQTEGGALKKVISDVRRKVEGGSSLRQAFEEYSDVFSVFFLGMIEAGEAGGKLATTLEESAKYMERQSETRRKVKSAFAYPIVVSVLCFLIVMCMIIFIVPVFSNLYRQLHVPLPGPTQFLVGLSVLIIDWWWVLILAVIGVISLVRFLGKKPIVRTGWDTFKLNMPVFANLNQMVVVSRFVRSFAMLASAGVSFIEALEVASHVANNSKVSGISKELQLSIETGNTMAEALKYHSLFPPIIVQLAASGEQIGALPEMLNKGVDFLDADISRAVNSLLTKLEPAMTVIMGAIVGVIMMAVYLPMFDYMTHLK